MTTMTYSLIDDSSAESFYVRYQHIARFLHFWENPVAGINTDLFLSTQFVNECVTSFETEFHKDRTASNAFALLIRLSSTFNLIAASEESERFGEIACNVYAYCLYGEWLLVERQKTGKNVQDYKISCRNFIRNFLYSIWVSGGSKPIPSNHSF